MDRRARLALAALGLAVLVAGCSGGGGEATPEYEDLTVDDFDVSEGENGSLVVSVTVANTASGPRNGTLYVNVEANGTTNTRVRRMAVDAAGTASTSVEFDVDYATFNDGGSLDFDFDEA